MQEIIQFLVSNTDVVSKVNEGLASLIGVSREEQQTIIDVFLDDKISQTAYFWM